MARRRVSLGESIRKVTDGNPRDDSGGLASFAVAVWYWIVGEPVPKGETPGD